MLSLHDQVPGVMTGCYPFIILSQQVMGIRHLPEFVTTLEAHSVESSQAPIGLYALFDGQSSASETPGHLAAEPEAQLVFFFPLPSSVKPAFCFVVRYCAKNFHKKAGSCLETFWGNKDTMDFSAR